MRPKILPPVLLLAGCITVEPSVFDRSWASGPIPTESVHVFLQKEGGILPTSCTRIAVLRATAGGSAGEGRMIQRLREEAGRLGANAIHVTTMNDPGAAGWLAGAAFDFEVESEAEVVALRCDDEALREGVRSEKAADDEDPLDPVADPRLSGPPDPDPFDGG